MTKLSTPLLSLGAHGSLSDSITYTRRRGADIAEKKPALPYSLTLPQQYQRWLYQDYAYLWTKQTSATKAIYAAKAARKHTTPIAEWLRYCLTNLPDIVAWWRLDEPQGAIAKDFSKNAYNGAILGTTIVDGTISKARYFDHLDDTIDCGTGISQSFTAISIECFISDAFSVPATYQFIIERGDWSDGEFGLYLNPFTHCIDFVLRDTTAQIISGATDVLARKHTHLLGTYDGAHMKLYVSGAEDAAPVASTGTVKTDTQKTYIGSRLDGVNRFGGVIDNLIIYNRALDTYEALRHSLRRYP